jgi:adenylate cyclase
MRDHENMEKSLVHRLMSKVGNPLEWSRVDKTLLFLGFVITLNVPFTLFLHLSLDIPGLPPAFFNRSMYEAGVHTQWAFVLLFSLLFGIGWLTRRSNPENRWLAYACAISIAVHDAWFVGGVGHSTSSGAFLTLFLMALIGLLFFDFRFTLLVIVSWFVVLGAEIAAEQTGLIPYASALVHSPHMNGKIDPWWMWASLAISVSITVLMLLMFGYVLNRWRKREKEVKELSEFLKNMFGRYLSTEVMESLLENPAAMELGGKRRTVTIMMTDLRGFTAQAERLQPEQVVHMLNTYFESMVDVVLKYNGTINEIVGDALLVIFGAPQEMPNRAQHAVACAIEMQNTIRQVNAQNLKMGLPELEMGIGLNDAQVIVGNIGSTKRSKYAVVGSGVNMTSRIESYTVGGQILISETVHREAGEVLRIDGQMDVVPKGAEGPIRIYEVGGIAGDYNLMLEEKDPELIILWRRIPLKYSVLEGKHEGRLGFTGSILKLSKKGAEIDAQGPLDLRTNLKMRLVEVDEGLAGKDFYGKITGVSGEPQPVYGVRFTSLPPEIDAYFQAHRQVAAKPGPESMTPPHLSPSP